MNDTMEGTASPDMITVKAANAFLQPLWSRNSCVISGPANVVAIDGVALIPNITIRPFRVIILGIGRAVAPATIVDKTFMVESRACSKKAEVSYGIS